MKNKILFIIIALLFFSSAIFWQMLYFVQPEVHFFKEQAKSLQTRKTEKKIFAPILVFHHIENPPKFLSRFSQEFFVDKDKLDSIISSLLIQNYKPVFVSEIVADLQNGIKPPANIVALSFDDGNEDFYTNAWPILQKYKVKASIYPITGAHTSGFLTTDQLEELDKSGLIEIGSHTVSHPFLTKIPRDEQYKQLKDSKDYLEKLLGKRVDILCYPFGLEDKDIEAIAKEIGYKAALKYNYSLWQDPTDLFAMSRLGVMPTANIFKILASMRLTSNK